MIKAIIAVDAEMGIGKDGTIPWPKNSHDLKRFKKLTTGHIVVMGSRTWNDPWFPGPLKDRDNYVITSKPDKITGANIINFLPLYEVVHMDNTSEKDVWIIGGANVINQFKGFIEEIYLTKIDGSYNCDVFFELPKNFELVSTSKEHGNEYQLFRKK